MSGSFAHFAVLSTIALLLTALASAVTDPTAQKSAPARGALDLNGDWGFKLDPKGEGEAGQWASGSTAFNDRIKVPGCWQAQGYGEPAGILRHYYGGDAWYRRTVAVPGEWRDKAVFVRVGGVLRRADLYVNGVFVGRHDGFSTPFEMDITDKGRAGADNVIAFRVGNTPGELITVPPHKQKPIAPTGTLTYLGNWGGLYGNVELQARSRTWVEHIHVIPDIEKKAATFEIDVRTREPKALRAQLTVAVSGGSGGQVYESSAEVNVEPSGVACRTVHVDMPDAKLWTPNSPNLHTARITLRSGDRDLDTVEQRFGLRQISTRGDVLLLNGKPFFLRGLGNDNVYVIDGVPSASKAFYLEQLRLLKSHGFNGVRFHSSVPVQEYFEAADEVGVMIMCELPAAYAQYFMPFKDYLKDELTRVLRIHGNHPSLLSVALGDELSPKILKAEQEQQAYAAAIAELYNYAKSLRPNHLVLSNDGNILRPTDLASLGRGQVSQHRKDVPLILHEFGGYHSSLPDLSLLNKFTGVMRATWLEEKKAWVDSNGLSAVYPTYVRNSQLLLAEAHKYEIEQARRNADVSGYQYWLGTDFPGGSGEGDSWEEGWFDYFGHPKPGATPEAGREINTPVLLMIGDGVDRRTLWGGEAKEVEVFISNFSDADLHDAKLHWSLKSADGTDAAQSAISGINLAIGHVASVARLSFTPPASDKPQKLQLVLNLSAAGASYTNHWSFWSFSRTGQLESSGNARVACAIESPKITAAYPFLRPANSAAPPGILIASALSSDVLEVLRGGGRVLLLSEPNKSDRKPNFAFFSAPGGAHGTLIARNAITDGLPHEGFCDLSFFKLLENSYACPLDGESLELTPLIGSIITKASWVSDKKELSRVGHLFEAKVGQGKLLVCTLGLRAGLEEDRPEAGYLFDQLLRYVISAEFEPRQQLGDPVLRLLAAP